MNKLIIMLAPLLTLSAFAETSVTKSTFDGAGRVATCKAELNAKSGFTKITATAKSEIAFPVGNMNNASLLASDIASVQSYNTGIALPVPTNESKIVRKNQTVYSAVNGTMNVTFGTKINGKTTYDARVDKAQILVQFLDQICK